MSKLRVDRDLIEQIAARLDLRPPNRDALETIAAELSRHYDVDGKARPFEGVVVSATGVGKTYILAAVIDYLAQAQGVRHFAVITPGRTILEKTVANFTPGTPKSLLGGMEVRPVVVTSENFASAAVRTAMDDPLAVKLYVFTVQALTRPTTQTGRRTHAFQEGLGDAFYSYLQAQPDLVVIADEHHCYYGEAFSGAIRSLNPYALIGLTATPHRKTPADQIIFRYPLIAAVADRLVKTPVIVGRRDLRTEPLTQLTDGVRLLEIKEAALTRWYQAHPDAPRIHPVMLVVAATIDEADEYASILQSEEFMGGAYRDAVLTVHSNAPDEALAALEKVEDPDSPVRILIAVGMLKEGWDVKNVYVLASMRSSVSEILTEQTLGRGLRLPFGTYTGVDMLDTLEVLAHERYEDLLRRAGLLSEQLVDFRTRAVLRYTGDGTVEFVRRETVRVDGQAAGQSASREEKGAQGSGRPFDVRLLEDYTLEPPKATMAAVLVARDPCSALRIPRLAMRPAPNIFSLADITDLEPFRKLGRSLAVDPDGHLRRTRLEARIVTDPSGMRRTVVVPSPAEDEVISRPQPLSLDVLRANLVTAIVQSAVVPQRKQEIRPAERIVDALLEGLGDKAQETLSAFFPKIAALFIDALTQQVRQIAGQSVVMLPEVELVPIRRERLGKEHTTENRTGEFHRGLAYVGWRRSVFEQAWFDSAPERDLANILDEAESIVCWLRLQRGDLPILWSGAGNWYNPDFLAVEQDGGHWVLEVKRDDMLKEASVREKRSQAERWASHVNADPKITNKWGYLLIPESAVRDASGSWAMVKRLAQAQTGA